MRTDSRKCKDTEVRKYHRISYKTQDGKRRYRSFRSAEKAIQFEKAVRKIHLEPTTAAQLDMLARKTGPLPLSKSIEMFLDASTHGTRGRVVLAETTLRGYTAKLKLVEKYIQQKDTRFIRRTDVVALKDTLVEVGYARRTITHILVTLRVMFNWLLEEGYVEENPTYRVGVKKDRNAPPEHLEREDIYSDDDVRRILATFDESQFCGLRDKTCLQLGFFAGLRISEILGLEWRHIDFVRKHITISQTAHDRNGSIQKTKTANSRRVVPMNRVIEEALLKWRECCLREQSRVFTATTGNPIIQRNALRALQQAQRRANVTPIRTLHAMRHYFTSKLIEAGFNVVHIARIIGHADVALTLRVYGHIINQTEDRSNEYEKISSVMQL